MSCISYTPGNTELADRITGSGYAMHEPPSEKYRWQWIQQLLLRIAQFSYRWWRCHLYRVPQHNEIGGQSFQRTQDVIIIVGGLVIIWIKIRCYKNISSVVLCCLVDPVVMAQFPTSANTYYQTNRKGRHFAGPDAPLQKPNNFFMPRLKMLLSVLKIYSPFSVYWLFNCNKWIFYDAAMEKTC